MARSSGPATAPPPPARRSARPPPPDRALPDRVHLLDDHRLHPRRGGRAGVLEAAPRRRSQRRGSLLNTCRPAAQRTCTLSPPVKASASGPAGLGGRARLTSGQQRLAEPQPQPSRNLTGAEVRSRPQVGLALSTAPAVIENPAAVTTEIAAASPGPPRSRGARPTGRRRGRPAVRTRGCAAASGAPG